MRLAVALVGALVLVASGCGGGEPSTSGRTVVAAFYPLAWAAERVADDDTEIVDLTPPGAEPHDVELTARDVERLGAADLVLYLGGGFMPALEDAVRGHEGGVDLLSGPSLLHVDEAPDSDDDGPAVDPHVWLDPGRFALMARTLAGELGDPIAADELAAELERLDDEFRTGLANCERREIVTSHAAFGYLADAYGLEQLALSGISPEAEPSPRALEELVAKVEDVGATTVFFETLVSPRVAETVAREAGVGTAALNPIEGLTEDEIDAGEDYLSLMRSNLATLERALGCR